MEGVKGPRSWKQSAKERLRILARQGWLMFAILGPFVVVSIDLVMMHRNRCTAALDEFELLSSDLAYVSLTESTVPDQPRAPTAVLRLGNNLEEKAKELAESRYVTDVKGDDAVRLQLLAFTAVHGLRKLQAESDAARMPILGPKDEAARHLATRLRKKIEADTRWSLAEVVSIQIFLVVCLPLLLLASVLRAEYRTRIGGYDVVAQSRRTRDARIVSRAKGVGWIGYRLAFAHLLQIGTIYILAPLGLKASYLAQVNALWTVPGRTSHFLWSTHFGDAPLMMVGFVGFFLYAITVTVQAYLADDLDDRLFLALLGRGLVVMLLCLALATTPLDDNVNRLLVFVAGILPMRAIEAVAARVQVTVDPELKSNTAGFEGLPHLSIQTVAALRRAGVESTHQLAMMSPGEIASEVRIDPPLLLSRLIDRAILIEAAGKTLFDELEQTGITTASQVVGMKSNEIAKLDEKLRVKVETLQAAFNPLPDPASLIAPSALAYPAIVGDVKARLRTLSEWADASVKAAEQVHNVKPR